MKRDIHGAACSVNIKTSFWGGFQEASAKQNRYFSFKFLCKVTSLVLNNLWLLESRAQQRKRGKFRRELGLNQLKVHYSIFFPHFGPLTRPFKKYTGDCKAFWVFSCHHLWNTNTSKKAIMYFLCVFLLVVGSSVTFDLGVPDRKHLPLTGPHFSKAKYVTVFNSATSLLPLFISPPVHKLKGSRYLRTVRRRRISSRSGNLILWHRVINVVLVQCPLFCR